MVQLWAKLWGGLFLVMILAVDADVRNATYTEEQTSSHKHRKKLRPLFENV